MAALNLFFVVIGSYLLGSMPFGYFIGKVFKKIDIRKYGSHNIGATNVFRVVGKKYGIICLILDIIKGFIPVTLLASLYYNQFNNFIPLSGLKILLGSATICGHVWPVYLKLRGGKGVATAFGVLLGMQPVAILTTLGVWLAIVLVFRIVSLGSIIAALSLPFIEAFFGVSIYQILFTIAVVVLIMFKHKDNIVRLIRGDESKI